MSETAVAESSNAELIALIDEHFREFKEGSIVNGTILDIRPQVVVVDIGYKSEGAIPVSEFEDEEIEVGDEVEVLLERLEDDEGLIVLSKEKAAHKQNWEKIMKVYEDGGLVKGKVKGAVKGGLIVNVGVEAFLPGSQVDIIPPRDLQEYVGNIYEFKIVKVNDDRKNLVISRREVIEAERAELRQKFLQTVTVGDKVEGQVKNITDFGAFVDLQGMDGLLHITDMSWGRISHPSEMLRIGQTLEVQILEVDREKERVSLGLKQMTDNPWQDIEARFPMGAEVSGKVTKLLPYGAFIEIEKGVEGLVHVSELSWV
ncbi:MAG: S1 RNA-binding domain-containing protein, partial [Verrucomicrobiaceae bacterium]|nr:S1 RNA-binding domain-containing protein [Verrucomicrobiaceae bacterium]